MVYRLRCLAIENPPPVKGMHLCRGAGTGRVRYPLSDESDKSDKSDGLHKLTGLDSMPASEGCPLHRHRSSALRATTDV